ncbi:hypothetical protein LZV00_19925 [Pseudomonas kielensis]|uniref:hypothetical protein n=1 Tax=Pseudomonas kielensis TaxID=2762577 RepID=UPI00223F97F4|nr:hypothetical protein [Pseudomonas kielensis]UZM12930.1 hypothetical protein LZV00_19925 [Pseudomonas kielensis]
MQTEFIDISDWPDDDEFSAAYPEGARPKRTLFSPANPIQTYIKPDWRHMFKRSAERYPEQFWAEIIAYEISILLRVPAPPCYAAFDSSNGQCGALSAWFYKEGDESFYSAGNFFHKIVPGFDRERGTQHNIVDSDEFNNKVLGKDQIYDFWSMMLFDVIVGNTDRHQDNWGHLLKAVRVSKSVARRKGELFDVKWRFAPWFDNGTSLGHELLSEKFTQWNDATLDGYIRRGKHHMRYSRTNLERMGHVDSLSFIKKHAGVRALLVKRLREFDLDALAGVLKRLVDLPAPPGGNLTKDRAEFILRLTHRRAQLAMETLNEHN